jgi:hypothetical protein
MSITFISGIILAIIGALFGYSHNKKKQGKQEILNDFNKKIAEEVKAKQKIQFDNSRLSADDRRERVQQYEKANGKIDN